MKRNVCTILLILVSAFAVASCGKKKPDASKYAAFCAEVIKCDKQLQALPTGSEFCGKFMAGVEAKVGEKVKEIESCVKAQSCEEKNMTKCIQLHAGTLMAPQ